MEIVGATRWFLVVDVDVDVDFVEGRSDSDDSDDSAGANKTRSSSPSHGSADGSNILFVCCSFFLSFFSFLLLASTPDHFRKKISKIWPFATTHSFAPELLPPSSPAIQTPNYHEMNRASYAIRTVVLRWDLVRV